ncbi:MAG: hypothetical protein R8K46_05030, partial [Mariprofundaceae bacterium]
LPLSLVIGGDKVLEHVKAQAHKVKEQTKEDPSVMSLPSATVLKDSEVVDMSNVSKEEFLSFFENVETRV